eukprot:CAMPEP_0198353316 /NCGR_PEP_ID=MMETSP1450-20131203/110949_1 /TAXON_ID=753684 ORGANISM="Madagascaria erythrocladiodes, Strain CCMP3234" /NCGR_SAMPLE_ID=MMETSP1450 /ASSEMBLY_ACC=CAM_ASM_001115 /LENGTH=63 /DNA_ID=CAMNT_0044059443 /DNA_START=19 /DNA_END=206 /DNA_ORIENTATION=-
MPHAASFELHLGALNVSAGVDGARVVHVSAGDDDSGLHVRPGANSVRFTVLADATECRACLEA